MTTAPFQTRTGRCPRPDQTPTGKGGPLAEVYGATDRMLARIDEVLTD